MGALWLRPTMALPSWQGWWLLPTRLREEVEVHGAPKGLHRLRQSAGSPATGKKESVTASLPKQTFSGSQRSPLIPPTILLLASSHIPILSQQ